MTDRLVFGCGFLGCRVAQGWAARGDRVFAVTRSDERCAELESRGLVPLRADVTRADTLADLPQCETVLYAIGWDRRTGQSRQQVYVEGLENVLQRLPPPTKLIFVSSTGVYGHADGAWVDETSPCRPRREASIAIYAAEQLLGRHGLAGRTVILRMAGMYGLGRMLRFDELRRQAPMPVAANSFINLIHVDDAARIVHAVADRVDPPELFNVSDGQPADRREYFAFGARLLGLPPPEFVEPAPTADSQRHDGENKRVCSCKLFDRLGIELQYPSYREGWTATGAP